MSARENEKLFERLLKGATKDIEVRFKMVLSSFARKVYDMISSTTKNTGDGNLPYDTGNLRDGTGVCLYYDGAMIKFIPPKRATKTQSCKGFRRISGTAFLEEALSSASKEYSSGLWVVLWSTVPYAVRVNSVGSKYWSAGWFDEGLVEGKLIPEFKALFARSFPELSSQINM